MYERQEYNKQLTEKLQNGIPWSMRYQEASSDNVSRATTIASYYLAVERVIKAVSQDLSQPFSLQDMADIAAVSPYHFNRIFRSLTGTPPLRFLSALRLAQAKELLLASKLSITSICFEVGYNSLGTFSSRFKELVGTTPTNLRALAESTAMPYPERFQLHPTAASRLPWRQPIVTGEVKASDLFAGPIIIGVFDTPIPQGKPITCAVLTAPGNYTISDVPNGKYYLFAVAPQWSDDPISYALLRRNHIRVGAGSKPVIVHNQRAQEPVNINLRRMRLIDPPILVDLLSLLVQKGYVKQNNMFNQTTHQIGAAGKEGGGDTWIS